MMTKLQLTSHSFSAFGMMTKLQLTSQLLSVFLMMIKLQLTSKLVIQCIWDDDQVTVD